MRTLTLLSVLSGIRNRDLAIVVAIVVIVLVLLLALASRRRRSPKLDLHKLDTTEGQRYADEFAAIERDFVDHPDQATAHAKGVVEEVMRRMGFPDRIDGQQRIRDLTGYNREAATSLTTADKDLRGNPDDTERLRRVLQSYRDVLHRLLEVPRAG